MKTILIFPPNFSIDQPYLALPSLVAFLRVNGILDVQQWDCNIDSFWHFCDIKIIKEVIKKIQKAHNELEANYLNLNIDEKNKYKVLCDAQLSFKPVIENIEDANYYFIDKKDETDIKEYTFYNRVIKKMFEIISAAYYPTEISLNDFTMRFSRQHSNEILDAISSSENPYLDYYKTVTIPRLINSKPDLIGVSIASLSQIIPSFTLAKLIRLSLPETKIVVGGQVFNRLLDRLMDSPKLFKFVDYFIIHEGETALLKLIKHIEKKIDISEVPNLVYFDNKNKIVRKTKTTHIEEISSLPIPDFSDLDLNKYLARNPVLPYQPVRGCYWHKCAFCNHHVVHPAESRAKSPDHVIHELRTMKDKYKTKYFAIVNESVHPSLLNDYATAFIKGKLKIEWYVGARFDSKLNTECISKLKESGCKKIYFGLESGTQKTLNDMCKGVTLRNAERILADCNEFGISVHLFIMIGFPTEGRQGFNNSKEKIKKLASILSSVGFTYYISIYQLKPCTNVFINPEQYQIKSVKESSDFDLGYLYQFEVNESIEEINYEKERLKIEEMLDGIHKSIYPENIVHFLTMRNYFFSNKNDRSIDKRGNDIRTGTYKMRPGLGCVSFRYYWNGTHQGLTNDSKPKYFIYDLTFDETFELKSEVIWKTIKELRNDFNKEQIRDKIKTYLKPNKVDDQMFINRLAGNIINSHLVIPANSYMRV